MKKYLLFLTLAISFSLFALSCNQKNSGKSTAELSDAAFQKIFAIDDSIMQGVPKFLYYVEGMSKENIIVKDDCSKNGLVMSAPNILIYDCDDNLTSNTQYSHTILLPNLRSNEKYTFEVSVDLASQLNIKPSVTIRKVGNMGSKEAPSPNFIETFEEIISTEADLADIKKELIEHGIDEGVISGFTTIAQLHEYIKNIPDNPLDEPVIYPNAYLTPVVTPIPADSKPSIVAYTFTPSEDGDYEAVVTFDTRSLNFAIGEDGIIKDATEEVTASLLDLPYFFILRFYKELGAEGNYGSAWNISNISPRDLVELRQVYYGGLEGNFSVIEDNSTEISTEVVNDIPLEYEYNTFGKFPTGTNINAKKDIDNNLNLAEYIPTYDQDNQILSSVVKTLKQHTRQAIEIKRFNFFDTSTSEIDDEVDVRMDESSSSRVGDLHLGSAHDAKVGFHKTDALNMFNLTRAVSPKGEVKMKVINSEQDLAQELDISIAANLGLDAISLKNTTKISQRGKIGLHSAVLVLRYEYVDKTFSRLNYDDYSQYIRPTALELFKKDKDAFLKEHGDYFVGGYRYGARFEALLTITASSYEKISTIKNALTLKISKLDLNNELQKKISECLKDTRVELSVTTMGADRGGSGDYNVTDYNKLIEKLNAFIRAAEKRENFDYVPLYAKLIRYRALKEFSSLPRNINVPRELLILSKSFVRAYNKLSSYYNSVYAIPEVNVFNANVTRNDWNNKYLDYKTKVDSSFEVILSSVGNIYKELNSLNQVSEDFRKLYERWTYYERLLAEQKTDKLSFQARPNTKSPDHNHANPSKDYLEGSFEQPLGWAQGVETYDISSEVTRAFSGCEDDRLQKPVKPFARWDGTIDMSGLGPDRYFRYWYIFDQSNSDELYQLKRPTIGTDTMNWRFKGGWFRAIDWRIKICVINMPKNDWPFVGLQNM